MSAIAVTLGTALMPLAAPSPAAGAVPAEAGAGSAEIGAALPWTGLTTPGGGVQLLYRGDLRAPGTVADSSGHGLDGTTLTPGDGMFSFGADVRLTAPPSAVAGMNVLQFGAAAAGLSRWKVQVDSGRPACRWSDGTAVMLLIADVTLSVGTWYRVRRDYSRSSAASARHWATFAQTICRHGAPCPAAAAES
jgi:hypothetical protein